MSEQTYHIRKRHQPRGGNQFYRDTTIRQSVAFCGGQITDKDTGWNDKSPVWVHEGITHVPCANCLKLRDEFKAAWKAGKVAQ